MGLNKDQLKMKEKTDRYIQINKILNLKKYKTLKKNF